MEQPLHTTAAPRAAGLSDEALAAQACRGDDYAFAQLVRRYEAPLYRYACRMLGNAAEAEDVFQETFLRVHQHLSHYRHGSLFQPWLYNIATNQCIDRLRRRKRRFFLSLDAAEPGERPLGERLEGNAPAPDALAQAHETAERIEAAIARLPLKHRTVFLMARYEQMSYDDIARALGVPTGTVKSRMNKATAAILAAMDRASTP